MFNLEEKISEWRQQMLAAGIKTPVPLEELESHLREEIEQQMKSGLNEQEIFNSAVQKIGQAIALKAEFKKVGGVIRVPFWLVMFGFSSFALFVTALFFPLFFGMGYMLGYMCVVTASVWEISHIIAVVCVVSISAIVLLPILRPSAKSWLLPFCLGLAVFALTICAAVYTFTIADKFHINLYFHPYDLIFLAIGALFCIGEGLVAKSRWRSALIV